MKIQDYLKGQGVAFRTHDHPPAYTAQEVAAEEHVSGNLLAKVVVVRAGKDHAMCVLPASYKLDMKKVGKALKAKDIQLAAEDEIARLFPDVEVGAEPPFGNLYNLRTVVDEHLAGRSEIVFQAGTHREAIHMNFDDYSRLAQPTVADIAVHL